jgi:hypothetical protein
MHLQVVAEAALFEELVQQTSQGLALLQEAGACVAPHDEVDRSQRRLLDGSISVSQRERVK